MRSLLTTAACTCAVVAATGVAVEPGQVRPGELTKGEVWIMNRASEAVPVDVTALTVDKPLRVLVTNGEAPSSPPVRVRVVPPTWEYRTIAVGRGVDPTGLLRQPGLDGWETTGHAWPWEDGTMLLLKRAR